MILEIADWKFDIDLETTMEYSAQEAKDHCNCAYCRNFYAAIDGIYPELRPFLAQFGLDIEAPEELMTFTPTLYLGVYAVCGVILKMGSRLAISGIPVDIGEDEQTPVCCPKPYFTIGIGTFEIPWVLDEPFEEVVSPANVPSFLKRMWNKLLGKAEDIVQS